MNGDDAIQIAETTNETLRTAPHRLRVAARRLRPQAVDREARMIQGVSLVTRGEAIGHNIWLDRTFLDQTAEAGRRAEKGIKSHFTHPGLSADGLGTTLGRMVNFQRRGDQVLADLAFFDHASTTPHGDYAAYVMDMAEESPDMFGASIVFGSDDAAMMKFAETNRVDGKFQSPDEDNTRNHPHARLAALAGADVVDDPAANPSGLFSAFAVGSELPAMAMLGFDYLFGLIQEIPPEMFGGIAPERVQVFFRKYLAMREIEIVTPAERIRLAGERRVEDSALALTIRKEIQRRITR
ncbi:MAG: hypothetical protein ABIL01_34100 [Pseudomonadota bacterium]